MGPIRGQTRPLPFAVSIVPKAQNIDAKLNASIHNRFDVEVIDSVTGKVRQRARAENVICNQLLTRMLSPAEYFNCIHYGKGTGTPTASDTSLFTFSGYGTPSTANDVYSGDYTTGVASLRRKIQLSETTAVGVTITEVGIGYSTTAATLCTHAMLKDMSGNQISITKTATDIINIYATVFVHVNVDTLESQSIYFTNLINAKFGILQALFGVISWSASASGSTYSGNYLACADFPCPGLGSIPSQYGDTYAEEITSNDCAKTYSAANKTITVTMTRLAAGGGNFSGGIHAIGLDSNCYARSADYSNHSTNKADLILVPNAAWITLSAITGEPLGTGDGSTVNFATDYPIASGGTVYVDGVATNCTIDTLKSPINGNLGKFFTLLPRYCTNLADASIANTMQPLIPRLDGVYSNSNGYYPLKMAVYYNPYFDAGVETFYCGDVSTTSVELSDDLSTWTALTITSGTVTIPTMLQHSKYWRVRCAGLSALSSSASAAGNIHFATAPASGAVITADYVPDTIPKDANHVFDLTVTIQLGEHTA